MAAKAYNNYVCNNSHGLINSVSVCVRERERVVCECINIYVMCCRRRRLRRLRRHSCFLRSHATHTFRKQNFISDADFVSSFTVFSVFYLCLCLCLRFHVVFVFCVLFMFLFGCSFSLCVVESAVTHNEWKNLSFVSSSTNAQLRAHNGKLQGLKWKRDPPPPSLHSLTLSELPTRFTYQRVLLLYVGVASRLSERFAVVFVVAIRLACYYIIIIFYNCKLPYNAANAIVSSARAERVLGHDMGFFFCIFKGFGSVFFFNYYYYWLSFFY